MKSFKKIIFQYFSAINQLQESIFVAYLKRDYYTKPFFYEKKLHYARRKFFSCILKVRKKIDAAWMPMFEELYEILFSMNCFKLRIGDHVAFEVCEQELKLITQSLRHILADLSRQRATQFSDLKNAIDQFEEVNRGAFQVVSDEPIVFYLFLQDLRALYSCLEKLHQKVVYDRITQ